MSKKLNAVIADETWEALDKIAALEKRTKSYMVAAFLAEAVEEYWRQNPQPEPPTAKPAVAKTKPAASRTKGRKTTKS